MQKMNTPNSYWNRIKKGALKVILFMFFIFTLVAIPRFGFVKALIFGVLFTSVWAVVFIGLYSLLDYIFLRRAFKKYGKVDYRISQFREVEIGCKKEAALDYAVSAIEKLKGIKKVYPDRIKQIIKARTKNSCKTLGEYIKIEIFEKQHGKVLFEIYSNPVIKTAFFDLAKNYENVEKISAFLKESAERK